tara:strand:- start:221 stop:607 length:387 start_codon:yes stop_codon:yes gene_type:complete
MAISIKRLGSDRDPDEGLRLGTVRRPPRGVRKEEFATKNYYDVWFPNLAPSSELLKSVLPITDETVWRRFARAYTAEMKQPGPAKDLDLLAALSHHVNFSLGCYCEQERFCHRSLLRELLRARGAVLR